MYKVKEAAFQLWYASVEILRPVLDIMQTLRCHTATLSSRLLVDYHVNEVCMRTTVGVVSPGQLMMVATASTVLCTNVGHRDECMFRTGGGRRTPQTKEWWWRCRSKLEVGARG